MGCTTLALDALIQELRAEFRRDQRGPKIAALLSGYASENQDWRAFTCFDPQHYTRNQLEYNEDFELLLLCWDIGHASPIHNHEGQSCWMAVVEGAIEEVQYRWKAGAPPLAGAPQYFSPGAVAFIRDEIGLHVVRNPAGGRAISLHLYARPFAECNVYCERTGEVSRRRLGYDSIRGMRVVPVQA